MTALTRRHFIAGGLAAGALGLAGLTGCAPAAEKSGEDVSASAGADGAATPAAGERPWEIAPAPIAEGVPQDKADEIKAKLEEAGAAVTVK